MTRTDVHRPSAINPERTTAMTKRIVPPDGYEVRPGYITMLGSNNRPFQVPGWRVVETTTGHLVRSIPYSWGRAALNRELMELARGTPA